MKKRRYIALAHITIGLSLGLFISTKIYKPEQEMINLVVEPVFAAEEKPQPTPQPKFTKTAKVTAYSCGGLKTEKEINMNCPSLRKYPKGRTATGTTPRPNITVACDRANLGRRFELEGVGEVVCEDVGGGIKGAGRFDLYVEDVQTARKWGNKKLQYREIL